MYYRSRPDIIAQILDSAIGGSKKKKIMYSSYLSYSQLMEYLYILLDSGLLEQSNNGYKTTPKGYRYLELYVRITEMMPGNMVQGRTKERKANEVLDFL